MYALAVTAIYYYLNLLYSYTAIYFAAEAMLKICLLLHETTYFNQILFPYSVASYCQSFLSQNPDLATS